MSKRAISALIAGFITTMGVTGTLTSPNQGTRASSSNIRTFDDLNSAGWYSNKAERGQAMHKRILKYMR